LVEVDPQIVIQVVSIIFKANRAFCVPRKTKSFFFSLATLYPLERPSDLFNIGLICFDK